MRTITIGSRVISDDSPCYVIAEIGNNHGGDVDRAVKLVEMAAAAGVSAVKFQIRTIDRLYTQSELDRSYDNPHSYGATYGAHRHALELSQAALESIWETARTVGIDCFATPFDPWAVDRLMELGVPAVKIASGDLGNIPLLKHVATLGLPMILSTGGAWCEDISRALLEIEAVNTDTPVAVLHCTSVYPAAPAQLNLLAVRALRIRYPETVIGYSGHDTGLQASIIASTLGASLIEKHVTLDRAAKGTDHAMSLEPQGVRKLVEDLAKARAALGDGRKRPLPEEAAGLNKWTSWREAHQ